MPDIRLVCASCGSEDLTVRALARWSVGDQRWVFESQYDEGGECHCEVCGESWFAEAELAGPKPRPKWVEAEDVRTAVLPLRNYTISGVDSFAVVTKKLRERLYELIGGYPYA